MSVLDCRDLSFAYEGRPVLSHVNFSLEKGSYLGIIGENGSGKSTLIKGILGLKKQASGEIRLHLPDAQKGMGYLPQQQTMKKDFPASVWEVVLSGRLSRLSFPYRYRKVDRDYAEHMLQFLSLSSLKNHAFRELSGGQQQRVLLARALAAGSQVLVLDEPVTGLDPRITEEMYAMLERCIHELGLTIMMVSHDLPACFMRFIRFCIWRKGSRCFSVRQKIFSKSIPKSYGKEGSCDVCCSGNAAVSLHGARAGGGHLDLDLCFAFGNQPGPQTVLHDR